MIDPWNILKLTKRFLLKNKSFVVALIPNFRFWHNLKEIVLNKAFNYKNSGILDKTHLRFFTRRSIIEMFEKNGFDIITIKNINPIQSKKFKFFNFMLLNKIREMKYMQFAVVAKPRSLH